MRHLALVLGMAEALKKQGGTEITLKNVRNVNKLLVVFHLYMKRPSSSFWLCEFRTYMMSYWIYVLIIYDIQQFLNRHILFEKNVLKSCITRTNKYV